MKQYLGLPQKLVFEKLVLVEVVYMKKDEEFLNVIWDDLNNTCNVNDVCIRVYFPSSLSWLVCCGCVIECTNVFVPKCEQGLHKTCAKHCIIHCTRTIRKSQNLLRAANQ
jgi:hypothetical protein